MRPDFSLKTIEDKNNMHTKPRRVKTKQTIGLFLEHMTEKYLGFLEGVFFCTTPTCLPEVIIVVVWYSEY